MVLKFNSVGHYLISRQTGIEISSKLKGIKYPQKAKTYDFVEIGHEFKPLTHNTQIITFRDKNGKIVQRNIINNKPNETIEVKKNYKYYSKTYIRNADDPLNWLGVLGRKISSVTQKNGVYVSKSEEIQTHIKKNSKPILTISKIESYSTGYPALERETQSLYEYGKGSRKGYSAQNYYRNNNSGLFKFSDYREDFENMENILKDDKYSMLYIYPLRQFKRVAPYVIESPLHTPPLTGIKWYSKYKHPEDKTISLGYYDGDVHLNRRSLITKSDVVRTTAHEKEHAYQRYERRKPIEQHTEETKKNIEAYNNYVSADDDFEQYKANYNETKAREAGLLAIKEYKTSLDNLRSNFPYAPNYQFGYYKN